MYNDFMDFADPSGYDLILIDGMNALHRASHAHSDLSITTSAGDTILTGATFGFINLVKSVWEKYADDPKKSRLVVCWDGGYRHRLQLYDGYKASRRNRNSDDLEPHQRDLPKQRKAVGRLLSMAGWNQAVADGFEADDVLATLARRYAGKRVAIYTMDQDLHQSVTDTTHVISARWGASVETINTPKEVRERWGVEPTRVPEVKALAGDSSDDIPGCPGCGAGWARKLLTADSLEGVLQRAKKEVLSGEFEGKAWKTPSLTGKIREQEALIRTCWELAKVVEDVPVSVSRTEPDVSKLSEAFRRLEFNSFLQGPSLRLILEIGAPLDEPTSAS